MQTDSKTNKQTGREAGGKTDGQKCRWLDSQTNRQRDRQTGWWVGSLSKTNIQLESSRGRVVMGRYERTFRLQTLIYTLHELIF
jgi:hypothetical protein